MKAVVETGKVTIYGPMPLEFLRVLSTLNGRKIWSQSKYVKVDASPWNIQKLKGSGFELEWDDVTHDLEHIDDIQQIFRDYGKPAVPVKHDYTPKYELKQHQVNALDI